MTPTIYKPKTIVELVSTIAEKRVGETFYRPCRPEGWPGLQLVRRLKCAWLAFTGAVDLVDWR